MIDTLESYRSALRLAATTRTAQREYFKTRDKGALIAARTLERQLDNLLRDLRIEALP